MVDSIRSKDVEIDALRSAQRRLLAKTEGLERECRWELVVVAVAVAVMMAMVAEVVIAASGGAVVHEASLMPCGKGTHHLQPT